MTNEQTVVEEFLKKCRSLGLNVTPQRLAIYQALVNDSTHPSPEMVYQKIKPTHPTISLATVYKTLETFEKHGLISVVTDLHNTVRYDPLTKRHHHLICVKCKKIVDIDDPDLNALKIPDVVTKNNVLIDFSVHFKVICEECRLKE